MEPDVQFPVFLGTSRIRGMTLNNGKLTQYFRSSCYAIVSNMTHFIILLGMREKNACFELTVSPEVAVLMQNQNEDIWTFHG